MLHSSPSSGSKTSTNSPSQGTMDTEVTMIDQQNSTSLKWGQDGELSDLDLRRILTLLTQSDPVAESLLRHRDQQEP
jgi:hypothetical protein